MIRTLLLVLLAVALLLLIRESDGRGLIPSDCPRKPYLQQVAGDRAIIAWRTSLLHHLSGVRLEWNYQENLILPAMEWNQATGETLLSKVDPEYCNHQVVLTGLLPQRVIEYRAYNGSRFIGRGQFKTDPGPDFEGPIRAWVLGDSGTGKPVQFKIRDAMLDHLSGESPDLFLHVGDMAYSDGLDGEFTARFFRAYRSVLSSTSCWPAPGNHELVSADSATQAGPYFEAYMLPKSGECGGQPSGTEAYYSFNYGPIHFISLDSSGDAIDPDGAMLRWLEEDLAANTQRWVIAFFHHPPYSMGSHPSNNFADSRGRLVKMREIAVPVLEAGGVDLVLAGHSHVYERSGLIQGVHGYGEPPSHPVADRDTLRAEGKILQWDEEIYQQREAIGTMYSVVGHGGGYSVLKGEHPVMVNSQEVFGSALITIEKDQLLFESVSSDGEVIDKVIIDQSSKNSHPGRSVEQRDR
ncbi:MAG: metallophosphoesterase [Planctomycetota bacterium]